MASHGHSHTNHPSAFNNRGALPRGEFGVELCALEHIHPPWTRVLTTADRRPAGYTAKVHIRDKYRIVGFISSGTYGRVYKALSATGRKGEYAIKKYILLVFFVWGSWHTVLR